MTTSRPDVFLSYSRENQAIGRRFAESLQGAGFSVWWDQALSTGEAYDEVTEKALEHAGAVVVLWSKASVASRWVRAEATTADRNRALFPVMIEACRRPIMFELTQSADLSGWNGDTNNPAWQAFIADLGRFLQRRKPAGSLTPATIGAPLPGAVSPAVGGARRGRLVALAAVVSMAVLAAGFLIWQRAASVKRARAEVPAISALVDAGNFPEAFARAQKVRRLVPEDSLLKSLTPLFTAVYAITSTPPGATVFVRGYDAVNDQWQRLGVTPLAHVELPRTAIRWRLEKAGFGTVERANTAAAYQNATAAFLTLEAGKLEVEMRPTGEQPPDTVFVAGGSSVGALGVFRNSRLAPVEVPSFFIDRFEVKNSAYREFIEAGGYERRSWWEGLDFRKDGKQLSFDEAMRLFVDATGRPGPATWELGNYPEGQGNHPVAGVSWYEAAAYARFRGKSVPTIYHWARAALPADDIASSLAASTTQLSNFGTAGPAPVSQYQGLGPYGTYDMFGNVREWLANLGPGGGWVIGGSWEDPRHSFSNVAPVPLIERSRLNGFRLIQDITEPANGAALRAAIDLASRFANSRSLTIVSDEVFASFKRQFEYTSGPLNATAVTTMATTEEWVKQRVTIDTGYNGERMDVILFVPRHARPPYQPIVLFSGSQIFSSTVTSDSVEPGYAGFPLDYVIKSGRLLVQPIFQGSYERFKRPLDPGDSVRMTSDLIQWRWDLGRTIDYLATRPDVDAMHTGYLGLSWGGMVPVAMLAVEPRLKAAVLLSGGLIALPTPFVNVANYAPRIKIPVLMVNGRFDESLRVETEQLPLFRLLGSPAADKRHVMLTAGHGSLPRAEVLRETLGWYDKYLGEAHR
ncbi:MAG: SUMF1/EgtB/PvdO family nonheme iron enzyme [Steroidobacteraceae bacterium]